MIIIFKIFRAVFILLYLLRRYFTCKIVNVYERSESFLSPLISQPFWAEKINRFAVGEDVNSAELKLVWGIMIIIIILLLVGNRRYHLVTIPLKKTSR